MGLFNLFKPARTVLVVDVVSLNEAAGQKGKIPPRNQLQMLRRLARFAQREKLAVVAVLTGTPLIKAPAGKKFEEITVLYSSSPDEHAKYLAKTAQSKGSGAVLVSSSAAAEKLAGNSVRKMRVSTFRKAFDTGSDDGGDDRSEGSNPRSRGSRPPRRRQQKPRNNKDNDNGRNEPKAERKPKPKSDTDAINELIDLVD